MTATEKRLRAAEETIVELRQEVADLRTALRMTRAITGAILGIDDDESDR